MKYACIHYQGTIWELITALAHCHVPGIFGSQNVISKVEKEVTERLELNMNLIYMEEESGRDWNCIKPFLRHTVELELNYLESRNFV